MHSLISLYVSDDSSQIIISDTLFSGNIGSVGGGALYLSIDWNTNLPLIVILSVHHEQSFYNWWVSCRYHCSQWDKTSLHGSIYLSTSFSSTSVSFQLQHCSWSPHLQIDSQLLKNRPLWIPSWLGVVFVAFIDIFTYHFFHKWQLPKELSHKLQSDGNREELMSPTLSTETWIMEVHVQHLNQQQCPFLQWVNLVGSHF